MALLLQYLCEKYILYIANIISTYHTIIMQTALLYTYAISNLYNGKYIHANTSFLSEQFIVEDMEFSYLA